MVNRIVVLPELVCGPLTCRLLSAASVEGTTSPSIRWSCVLTMLTGQAVKERSGSPRRLLSPSDSNRRHLSGTTGSNQPEKGREGRA